MARLDLYRLQGMAGYLLDVQADLMSILSTTVVVPLLPLASAPKPITRLNPIFEVNGERYVMVTQSLSAVARKELGAPVGAIDRRHEYDATNALDMLLSGS
jgi:toxin CcdB